MFFLSYTSLAYIDENEVLILCRKKDPDTQRCEYQAPRSRGKAKLQGVTQSLPSLWWAVHTPGSAASNLSSVPQSKTLFPFSFYLFTEWQKENGF